MPSLRKLFSGWRQGAQDKVRDLLWMGLRAKGTF